MKIFKKTKKGFTLVELVVVIAVIAILAAVSVGAYFGVTESANKSKLEQESKQVYTAIQTVALAPNNHSNLSKSGLEIKDTAEFEKALEGNLGFDVALTDELKKDPSRPTIYFSDAAYSSAFGDKIYKTFTYLLPEIANKGAVADIVTGECRATESSAVEEELGDNDKEHFTASVVIAEYADAHGWVDAIQYESIEINENIYVSAVGGGNTAKYYENGENWRIYQNESPKIEIKGTTTDIFIKSVTITYNSEKTGALIYNGNKVASNSEVVVNSNSATFGVGNTKESVDNGQVRITSINVNYYSDLTVEEPTTPPVDEGETVTSIEGALTAEVGTKAELTGTVCEIYVPWDNSTSTISFNITDENENKISVYGCSCSQEILLGDIVKVTGVIKVHNSKNQVSDNPSAEVTGHDSSYDYTITSIDEALLAAEGSKVCLEGEVVDIYEEYNSDYNNISVYIEDSNGSKILVFRMTGNVNFHDKIIVTGFIGKYEGINQIGQGATFEDTNEDGSHRYSEATCTEPEKCTICESVGSPALNHTDPDENGNCTRCHQNIVAARKNIKFDFGENGEASHKDGSEIDEFSETIDGYTLTLSELTKVYSGATDALGNSCLKLGTGSATASFNISVPENVIEIHFEIAGYKANEGKFIINGTEYKTSKKSNDGEYETFVINVVSTGVVSFETTTSPDKRLMVNSISFVIPDEPSGEEKETVTVSKTVASLITEYGWTDTTTKQSFNIDDNVSVKIDGGSNTGKAYNGDHIRIYATDTPAGTITISVPEGYELVSIKISTQSGTYAFLYVDGTSTDISNELTEVSGTSVTLNSVKNGSDGKQVRVTGFQVTYKKIVS